LSASTARLAMILSLPEIEFDVMSVSSSIAASTSPCDATARAASWVVTAASTVSTACSRMRATMLDGSRNRNTYAKYGSITTRPSVVNTSIATIATCGTNVDLTAIDSHTPHTQATTKYAITATLTLSRRNICATPV
jgi:hypothetical protein